MVKAGLAVKTHLLHLPRTWVQFLASTRLQLTFITPDPGHLMPSSGLCRHQGHTLYTYTVHTGKTLFQLFCMYECVVFFAENDAFVVFQVFLSSLNYFKKIPPKPTKVTKLRVKGYKIFPSFCL